MTDWSPLAGTDPVPGSPSTVRALAGRFGSVSAELQRQTPVLRRIGQDVTWKGSAADRFRDTVSDLPGQLDAVATRFEGVSRALAGFAGALEHAQGRARAALARAKEAEAGVQAAASAAARDPEPAPGPGQGQARAQWAVRQRGYESRRAGHTADLAAARRMLEEAVAERDTAARAAVGAFGHAGQDRLRNPSGWHAFLRKVADWAGKIAAGLGVAALVLCWVPGVGQVLGALALVASVAALAATLTLKLQYDEGSWADIAVDAGMLALGGVGKALKGGAVLIRSTRATRALTRVSTASRLQATFRGRAYRALFTLRLPTAARNFDYLARSRAVLQSSRQELRLANRADLRRRILTGLREESWREHPLIGGADFLQALRNGRSARGGLLGREGLVRFVTSPGQIQQDIARARAGGWPGVTMLAAGYTLDVASAADPSGAVPAPDLAGRVKETLK